MSTLLPFENSTSLSLGELKCCQKQIKMDASQHSKIQMDPTSDGFSVPLNPPLMCDVMSLSFLCLSLFSILGCIEFRTFVYKSKQHRYFTRSPPADLPIDRSLLRKPAFGFSPESQCTLLPFFLNTRKVNVTTSQWRSWTTIQETTLKIYWNLPKLSRNKGIQPQKNRIEKTPRGDKNAEIKFGRKCLLLSNKQNSTDSDFEIPFLGGILEVSCQNVLVGGLLGRVGLEVEEATLFSLI